MSFNRTLYVICHIYSLFLSHVAKSLTNYTKHDFCIVRIYPKRDIVKKIIYLKRDIVNIPFEICGKIRMNKQKRR